MLFSCLFRSFLSTFFGGGVIQFKSILINLWQKNWKTYRLIQYSMISLETYTKYNVSYCLIIWPQSNIQVRIRVLPGHSERVNYSLIPLLAGTVQLPKLSLTTESHNPSSLNYESLLTRILPTHIFIMVSVKFWQVVRLGILIF